MRFSLLPKALQTILLRPDLNVIGHNLTIKYIPSSLPITIHLNTPKITLGLPFEDISQHAPTLLRYGIELLHLSREGVPHLLSCLASARIAALFHTLDTHNAPEIPSFLRPFLTSKPSYHALLRALPKLLLSTPDIHINTQEIEEHISTAIVLWPFLSPTEDIMGEGGDSRLSINPDTGLNRYSCSHRPRPWAITFGSSTASSLSERGFGGAEKARQKMMQELLHGDSPEEIQNTLLHSIRKRIGKHFNLTQDNVILNASGTDCELTALALTITQTKRPITNILIAPEETGSGVPLAAQGRHFSQESACSQSVQKGEFLKGFPQNTAIINIPIRHTDGSAKLLKEIDEECSYIVHHEIQKERHVLLHRLDQSKTGIAAPSLSCTHTLSKKFNTHLSIVIDACQARISPRRITQWIHNNYMVMLTGSKFFTGPPFCGALLIPTKFQKDLAKKILPNGLKNYSNRSEWPHTADPTALGTHYNLGLALDGKRPF